MENVKTKNNDSKKIVVLLVLIATFMVTITGGTYAYFAISASNNNVITGTAASANLTMSVTKVLPTKTNNGKLVPQREAGLATAMNSTNGCVDANANLVCQVWKITVSNGSTAVVRVKGTIQFAGSTGMPNLKWRLATGTNTLGSNTTTAANNTSEQTFVSSKQLFASGTSGNSTDYYIVTWINAAMNSSGVEIAQSDTGSYTATIKFVSVDASGAVNGGVTSTITS